MNAVLVWVPAVVLGGLCVAVIAATVLVVVDDWLTARKGDR